VETAIESIYRDLEYARSLIKRTMTDEDDEDEMGTEHATIKDDDHAYPYTSHPSSGSHSGYSSSGSARGAPSEDWSVISEQDDRRSSLGSRRSESQLSRSGSAKRTSFTAAVLSVLPDSFAPGSPRSTRHRALSTSS
jgi:sterol 3beta-glucosyltransferase